MIDTRLVSVTCPYCGETIDLRVDCSVESQQYTEDCRVCCQPMVVKVNVGPDGVPEVGVLREDDA